MNAEEIYNEKDFKSGIIGINRKEYEFPEKPGLNDIVGKVACKYWGKKANIMLLMNCIDGEKLKFSFWRNTGYCCEPIPKRQINVKRESIRYIKNGTKIKLTYENKNGSITRIRDLVILKKTEFNLSYIE